MRFIFTLGILVLLPTFCFAENYWSISGGVWFPDQSRIIERTVNRVSFNNESHSVLSTFNPVQFPGSTVNHYGNSLILKTRRLHVLPIPTTASEAYDSIEARNANGTNLNPTIVGVYTDVINTIEGLVDDITVAIKVDDQLSTGIVCFNTVTKTGIRKLTVLRNGGFDDESGGGDSADLSDFNFFRGEYNTSLTRHSSSVIDPYQMLRGAISFILLPPPIGSSTSQIYSDVDLTEFNRFRNNFNKPLDVTMAEAESALCGFPALTP